MKYKQIFIIILILSCMIVFASGCSNDPITSFEVKGDMAFEEKSYKHALLNWMKSIDNGIDTSGQLRLYH